jgi:isopenicillin-N epimerase
MIVPAAIDFQAQHDWPAVRQRCHDLARRTRAEINAVTGLDPICPDSPEWLMQMFAARPPEVEAELLQRRLHERHRI